MTARFRKIDDQNRGDHFNLSAEDECYFLFEYTSGKRYDFSATNSLISNLKKKPSLKGTAQYSYKTQAMNLCGRFLGAAINPRWLQNATLVPVPPSKFRNDPEYDDRISRICRSIPTEGFEADVRDIVIQNTSLPAAHEGQRPTIEELVAVYEIDKTQAQPAPNKIGIVDDVLTAGVHYCAMKTVLQRQYPGIPIVGFFIARRVFPNPFEALQDGE